MIDGIQQCYKATPGAEHSAEQDRANNDFRPHAAKQHSKYACTRPCLQWFHVAMSSTYTNEADKAHPDWIACQHVHNRALHLLAYATGQGHKAVCQETDHLL